LALPLGGGAETAHPFLCALGWHFRSEKAMATDSRAEKLRRNKVDIKTNTNTVQQLVAFC